MGFPELNIIWEKIWTWLEAVAIWELYSFYNVKETNLYMNLLLTLRQGKTLESFRYNRYVNKDILRWLFVYMFYSNINLIVLL